MAAYAQHFDHVIAIVAQCHLRTVTLDHLAGASLWTYDHNGEFSVLHRGKINVLEDTALENILTKAERRKGDFMSAMTARYANTSDQFWQAVARRAIRSDDLPLLSRFSDSRTQARRIVAERDAQWSNWLAAQGCC